jgi:hypothetical protein
MMLFGLGTVQEGQVRVAPTEPWDVPTTQAPPLPMAQPASTTPWYLQWYVLLPVLLGGVWFYRRRHKRMEQSS